MNVYMLYNLILINASGFYFITKPPGYSDLNDKINLADYVPENDDIKVCILNNWWDLARKIVEKSRERNIDLSHVIYSTIEQVQRDSKELINLLNNDECELDVVNAALQWAESPHEVFLNIKFSPRWSSPGAINVETESLNVKDNVFEYSGIGEHYGKKKKYQVKLLLFDNVIASQTKTAPSSTGRLTITLRKSKSYVWNQLLNPTFKYNNIHIWLDMKEKYKEDCDNFAEEKEL